MKKPVLQAVLLTALLGSVSSASANGFLLFYSGHLPVGKGECPQVKLNMSEHASEEDAEAARREAFSTLGLTNKRDLIARPGYYSIVYKYRTTSVMFPQCQWEAYAAVRGDNEEHARRKMADHAAEFPKYFLTAPEIVRVWTGGFLKTVIRDYDGVAITYNARRKGSSTAIFARLKNAHLDKEALVRFRINGTLQERVHSVPPGGTASVELGIVENVGAALRFVEPAEKKRSVIDWIKHEVIKPYVVKDGLIKVDNSTVTGVKG